MAVEQVSDDGVPPTIEAYLDRLETVPMFECTVDRSLGYQELVDEGLVEKKRGRGMFVTEGARVQLLKDERRRFVEKDWPVVAATIERLGLNAEDLLKEIKTSKSAGDSGKGKKND